MLCRIHFLSTGGTTPWSLVGEIAGEALEEMSVRIPCE